MKIKKILVLLALSFINSQVYAGELIDESIEVDADEVIDIELINGTVTLIGWDQNLFQIKGELSDDAEGFELERRGGITHFEEEMDGWNWRGNCDSWFRCNRDDSGSWAELEIFVPTNSTVNFEAVNVELDISNLHGSTAIELVNGSIAADNLSGIVKLETVNGEINSTNLAGRINLSTVNGGIRDRNSAGSRVNFSAVNGDIDSDIQAARVSAESVSGSVNLELGDVDDMEASSVSGDMDIIFNLNSSGQAEISSVSGDVNINLDTTISARFDLSTAVGGDIDNNLTDDRAVQENRYINSSKLRFSMNGGDASIDASTVSGDINLNVK